MLWSQVQSKTYLTYPRKKIDQPYLMTSSSLYAETTLEMAEQG